jgi:hypothetical protein
MPVNPAPTTSATDFEIHAPDDATMMAVAQTIQGLWNPGNPAFNIAPGINTGGISADGYVWTINYYGKKLLPTGNTVAGRNGVQVPEYALAPGVFAILRWNGDTSKIPQPPADSGVTIIPLPADSPFVFA